MDPESGVTPETVNKNVIVAVTGLALGEETKGITAQWLTREFGAHTILRSGGCQAGQELTLADGSRLELTHFGAGILDGAHTHLLHFATFPVYLYEESLRIKELGIDHPLRRISVDRDCVIVTPFHGAYSRLEERSRGEQRRGTVGMGASEAVGESRSIPELSILAGDLIDDRNLLAQKVEAIRLHKLEQARELVELHNALLTLEGAREDYELLQNEDFSRTVVQSFLHFADLVQIVDKDYVDEILHKEGAVICQPTHGALHHPRFGFVPHVTQIDPTGQDVLETLSHHKHDKKLIRLGVSRCYITRQGAGPLVSYSPKLSELHHNPHDESGASWLGEFRNGYYDLVAIKYALEFSRGQKSFDGLVISHFDILNQFTDWQVVEAYEYEGEKPEDISDYFEIEGDKIIGIKVHQDTGDSSHIDHQIRLTKLLNNCRPILTTLSAENGNLLEETFITFIEKRLGIPVVTVAHGPKAEDRMKRPAWNTVFRR